SETGAQAQYEEPFEAGGHIPRRSPRRSASTHQITAKHAGPSFDTEDPRGGQNRSRNVVSSKNTEKKATKKKKNTKLPLLSRTQKTAAAMTAARHKQKQADDTRPLPVRLRLRPCDLPFGCSQQTTQTQPHVANKNGGQSALVKVLCWRLAGRIPRHPKKEAPLSRLLRCRLRRLLADDEVGTSGHHRRNNSIRRTTCVRF
ncbi:unnamed protein product, partial [Ixodes persulcatus]